MAMDGDRDEAARRERYLIPRPVPTGFELFPGSGWGLREMAQALAGAGVGVGAAALALALHAPLPVPVALAVLLGGGGVGLAAPQPSGDTYWTLIGRMRAYRRSRTRWLFDYRREDV